jgi:hypothetical protein
VRGDILYSATPGLGEGSPVERTRRIHLMPRVYTTRRWEALTGYGVMDRNVTVGRIVALTEVAATEQHLLPARIRAEVGRG